MTIISEDMRTFNLRALFLIVATFAVACGASQFFVVHPHGLIFCVTGFWFGFTLLAISDRIDDQPIDARSSMSQALNVAGLLVSVISCFLALAVLAMNAMALALITPRLLFGNS